MEPASLLGLLTQATHDVIGRIGRSAAQGKHLRRKLSGSNHSATRSLSQRQLKALAMTIRFAAARPSMTAFIGRTLWAVDLPPPVNDNAAANARAARASAPGPAQPRLPEVPQPEGAELLRTALLHFAVHGFSAAAEARREAQRCFAAGRHDEYRYWLNLCRHFDRRMAAALARKLNGKGLPRAPRLQT